MQYRRFSAPLSALFASALLSVAASGAMAQTQVPATNPTTVGVTPQEAAEATRKAIPRADTGTLVRTDESVADRARSAVDGVNAQTADTPATTANQPMAATTQMPKSSMSEDTATPQSKAARASNMQRRARADRN